MSYWKKEILEIIECMRAELIKLEKAIPPEQCPEIEGFRFDLDTIESIVKREINE